MMDTPTYPKIDTAYVNLDVHPNLGTTIVGTAGQIPLRGSNANQYPRGPN